VGMGGELWESCRLYNQGNDERWGGLTRRGEKGSSRGEDGKRGGSEKTSMGKCRTISMPLKNLIRPTHSAMGKDMVRHGRGPKKI